MKTIFFTQIFTVLMSRSLSGHAQILKLWTEKILIQEHISFLVWSRRKKKNFFLLYELWKWRHEAWWCCPAFCYVFITFVFVFHDNLSVSENSLFPLQTKLERAPKNALLCRYKLFWIIVQSSFFFEPWEISRKKKRSNLDSTGWFLAF